MNYTEHRAAELARNTAYANKRAMIAEIIAARLDGQTTPNGHNAITATINADTPTLVNLPHNTAISVSTDWNASDHNARACLSFFNRVHFIPSDLRVKDITASLDRDVNAILRDWERKQLSGILAAFDSISESARAANEYANAVESAIARFKEISPGTLLQSGRSDESGRMYYRHGESWGDVQISDKSVRFEGYLSHDKFAALLRERAN